MDSAKGIVGVEKEDMSKKSPVQKFVTAQNKKLVSVIEKISPGGKYYKFAIWLLVGLAVILSVIVGLYLTPRATLNQQITGITGIKYASIPTPVNSTPAPRSCSIVLRPDNGLKGTYSVSSGKHDGPSTTQVILDPLDVKKSQTLNITLKVTNSTPDTQMTGNLQEDNSGQDIVFTKTSEDKTGSFWTGSVTLTDSVNCIYILVIKAAAGQNWSQVTVGPRS